LVGRFAEADELGMAVGPDRAVFVGELVEGLEREWAISLVDLLQRRTMCGLGAGFGIETAPAAAEWLVRLGLWDKHRGQAELAAYRDHARRFRAQ
jgi:glycerol-3-phosphate dehydrogenase